MPIVRKIIQVGNARAITLPKSWLAFLEKKTGAKIEEVLVEVDGSLVIKPLLPNEGGEEDGSL